MFKLSEDNDITLIKRKLQVKVVNFVSYWYMQEQLEFILIQRIVYIKENNQENKKPMQLFLEDVKADTM